MNANQTDSTATAAWRKRLHYRAWHRGTRETDLLIGGFADKYLGNFGETELEQFETLLICSDPELYELMTGKGDVPTHPSAQMLQHLKEYSLNRGR